MAVAHAQAAVVRTGLGFESSFPDAEVAGLGIGQAAGGVAYWGWSSLGLERGIQQLRQLVLRQGSVSGSVDRR